MTELPEALTLAKQLRDTVAGRSVARVEAGRSPHGFAFYSLPTEEYPAVLAGRPLGPAEAHGMFIFMSAGENALLLGDGINLRYYAEAAEAPPKHQLLLELEGGGALVCSVQMYGGMWACPGGVCDNPYYRTALEKPSPLSEAFDAAYFEGLLASAKPTLSAKAFLATEQRIPGLGNGTLQDILFRARINPRRKIATLDGAERRTLFTATRETLREMTDAGGRDTERDLFGQPGGYRTILSKNTLDDPCPVCGATIVKEPYLGGAVYYCPKCQPI